MIRTKLITASVVVLILTLSLGAGGPATPEPADVVSTLLDYDGSSCSANCELTVCKDKEGGHAVIDTPGGNDIGPSHGCDYGSDCWFHDCQKGMTLAPSELETVVELIPEVPVRQLVAMHNTEPNLILNRERQAVQVLGCQGTVLASVKLTPVQIADFEGLN